LRTLGLEAGVRGDKAWSEVASGKNTAELPDVARPNRGRLWRDRGLADGPACARCLGCIGLCGDRGRRCKRGDRRGAAAGGVLRMSTTGARPHEQTAAGGIVCDR
jgi:hypothetical protein